MRLSSSLLILSATLALASPLQPRAAPDNTVLIQSTTKCCHTDIGESEKPGGMRVYCSASARTDNSQGLFPTTSGKKVTYKTGTGKKGKKYVQLTGRINKGFSQLNDNDGGGQYDSSGGAGGKGNPQGSVCTGYKHYVQLVEPNDGRACIRCCQDYNDCPLDKDTAGCPAVIPGTY
ncbi:hypothetical protein RhiXN_07229 [Rhizoctonia solani]|uniref:Uncharacterized protein n=1 Tax=Rhizoctonia solani TaxID=456999 RepID=A0A8H8P508_9AGAM|nr:uncharacterized protein RhiXN_07229 [Rhizoctonia solani]QRW25280.1 hypothetical protein RhiXN_07229 [Rhizoctonia solani]